MRAPWTTEGKIRPVLLVSNPLPVADGRDTKGLGSDYTALRLARIPHDADHYAAVRDQEEPLLFHLDRARTKGLSRKGEHRDQAGNEFDYAVMLNALVRLHETALVGVPGGQLNSNEYRVLCQRLIEMLGLDTSEP